MISVTPRRFLEGNELSTQAPGVLKRQVQDKAQQVVNRFLLEYCAARRAMATTMANLCFWDSVFLRIEHLHQAELANRSWSPG
jgi:hypothetical protein